MQHRRAQTGRQRGHSMRIIVYGVGAIGGTVAAALALAGQEVVGIARGAQLAAIRAGGLLLRTPEQAARARVPLRRRSRPRSPSARTTRSC